MDEASSGAAPKPWDEIVRGHLVEYVLEVRRDYLASGASALTHWTQIEQRLRASARTTATAAEWASDVARRLRLPAASRDRSSVMTEIVASTGDRHRAFLDLVQRETPYVIALARVEADRIRQDRDALAAEGNGEA